MVFLYVYFGFVYFFLIFCLQQRSDNTRYKIYPLTMFCYLLYFKLLKVFNFMIKAITLQEIRQEIKKSRKTTEPKQTPPDFLRYINKVTRQGYKVYLS